MPGSRGNCCGRREPRGNPGRSGPLQSTQQGTHGRGHPPAHLAESYRNARRIARGRRFGIYRHRPKLTRKYRGTATLSTGDRRRRSTHSRGSRPGSSKRSRTALRIPGTRGGSYRFAHPPSERGQPRFRLQRGPHNAARTAALVRQGS